MQAMNNSNWKIKLYMRRARFHFFEKITYKNQIPTTYDRFGVMNSLQYNSTVQYSAVRYSQRQSLKCYDPW
jgi:hypothetical protein